MKKCKGFWGAWAVAVVAILLVACGGDSSSGSENEGHAAKEGDECSEDLQKARVFLKKTETYYVCVDGKLVPVDADKSSSSESSSNSSSSAKGESKASSSSSAKDESKTPSSSSSVKDSSVKEDSKSSSSIYLDLSGCEKEQEGSYIYMEESGKYFVCKDSEWKETEKSDLDLDKIKCDEKSGDILNCFVDASSSSAESSSDSEPFEYEVGETFTDERDGQIYRQVVIGNQLWMAQNLNYASKKSVCPSDDAGEYCEGYGRLYPYVDRDVPQWVSLLGDDLCPRGWAIPSQQQWETLISYVDANNGDEGVGKSLKASKGWFAEGTVVQNLYGPSRTAVASGKDSFGFSALPAGSRWDASIYTHDDTRFWARTFDPEYDEYQRGEAFIGYQLTFDSDTVGIDPSSYASGGFSIRCINIEYEIGFEVGYCIESRDGEMVEVAGDLYMCDKGVWRNANAAERFLGVCSDKQEGTSKLYKNPMSQSYPEGNEYYTCEKGHWREATKMESYVALANEFPGECTSELLGRSIRVNYYDKDRRTYLNPLMICDQDGWREGSEIEGQLGLCNAAIENEIKPYIMDYMVCEKGQWREATVLEELEFRGGKCTAKIQDSLLLCYKDYSYYLCDNSEWRVVSAEENEKGLACTKDAQLVKGNYYGYFVCDGDTIRPTSYTERNLSRGCTSYNEGDTVVTAQTGIVISYSECIEGSWKSFKDLDSTVFEKVTDERDDKVYRAIQIGGQTWFAENLNYEMEDGSSCYGDTLDYCSVYGRLYTEPAAAMACPAGWHLPTKDEVNVLLDSIDNLVTLNLNSRTDSLKTLMDFSWNGTNVLGFSGLPGGYVGYENGVYSMVGRAAGWWTSTEYGDNFAYAFGVIPNMKVVDSYDLTSKFSVRCVKNVAQDEE